MTLFDYANRVAAQHHSDTSEAAAESVRPSAATLRDRVLAYLRTHGPATDEEVQFALGMPANTQRPRRVELVERGMVRDSGRTRATRSGRQAVIWIAAEVSHD